MPVNMLSFTAAVMLGTLSILSLGFVLASLVPTARFAQPLGAAVLYPMLASRACSFRSSGCRSRCASSAYALPTTHAVALMQGVWDGAGWARR